MYFILRFRMLCVCVALLVSFSLQAAEPLLNPQLRIDAGEHAAMVRRIATDVQGRWLVTGSDDKTAKVWDIADGRLLTTLRPPIGLGNEGKIFSVAMSPDGSTVAVSGWTQFNNGLYDGAADGHTIYLFDRSTGQLLNRINGLANAVLHLAYSYDGAVLAATLGGANGLRIFSASSGQQLADDHDYGADSYCVDFSADGRVLTSSYDGMLRLYRFDNNRLSLQSKRSAPGGDKPSAARFSPDGRRIAVGFDGTPSVNVLNGFDLSFSFAADTSGVDSSLLNVIWSQDGSVLYAGGQSPKQFDGVWQRYVRRWDSSGAGAATDWPVAGDTVMALASLPGGRLAFGTADPTWGVLDATGRKVVFHAQILADFRDNQEGFRLSSDGAKINFGYQSFGKSPVVFDTLNHIFLPENTPNLSPPLIESPGMVVTDWKYTFAPKLNGKKLELRPFERSRSLAMLPGGDGFVLGSDWALRFFSSTGELRWKISTPGVVWNVNISRDGRWVVATIGDGTIRWFRVADGTEQLAFYPHPDMKRWVMWTPEGYYDASLGAEDMIGWHLNRGKDKAADFFPASRFRNQFNRPDVLAYVLDTGSEVEALRFANLAAGRKTQVVSITNVLPPVVNIVTPDDGLTVSSSEITLKYSTRTPDDAPVTGIRVRVNGLAVNLTGMRNLAVAATNGESEHEISVPIPPQDSEIQLFAENRNGVSTPASLRVIWGGQQTAAEDESQFKPKLYVLAVGVSQYKNPEYNLGLAAKDATDFAAVFFKQKGKLYGDVQVRLLTDDKASKDDVLDGLEWLKREVTSRDVGVMFLAGHGMNDNIGNYYYLPYNVNPDQLMRTGVAQNDIKLTLNTLAGKAVFFVDTCHSGNALGSAKTRAIGGTTDAFVNELASAENGVIVFSSSTGRQLSQEDAAWGNGAFTKAVVEGLSGKADFQRSGKITHKGLDYYVTERVKELTHGQQSPVSLSPSGITDFPIAISGK